MRNSRISNHPRKLADHLGVTTEGSYELQHGRYKLAGTLRCGVRAAQRADPTTKLEGERAIVRLLGSIIPHSLLPEILSPFQYDSETW